MKTSLSPESIRKSAVKKAGTGDFGDSSFNEPLDRLLTALEEAGDLHSFGRFYVKEVLTELLANRLKMVDFGKRHAGIANERITQPVIILGLPRSGTSFLFNLLSRDPAHRVLSNWEATVSQVPPEGKYQYLSDPRRKKGRYLMRFQNYLVPQMQEMHRFYLDGPEECTPILMQDFSTQALAGMFNAPAYSEWLDKAPHAATYRHHKQALQTLQWKYPGERWLLKSPDHIAAIEAILDVYPDACLVHIHRDPVKSVSSWASLNLAFRGIYTNTVDVKQLGLQVLGRLSTDMRNYLAKRKACDPDRFIDLHFDDLIKDPMRSVQSIYKHFDLNLSPDAVSQIQKYLVKERQKRSTHHYTPEDFGLTTQLIRDQFQEYIDAFNVSSANTGLKNQ